LNPENSPTEAVPFRVVILMPIYRDWQSATMLCRSLDEEIGRLDGVQARILLVDDASPDGSRGWSLPECWSLERIDVLRLRRNLGHQRAIGAGLCYVHDYIRCDAVLVMDADGEDQPQDAIKMIGRMRVDRTVFFAERRRRQEGLLFRTGYFFFRILHRLLTGVPVRVGNFSIVPFPVVRRLVTMPELWNHFAGAIYKSKAPFQCIPMDRGKRLQGRSHMEMSALVAHGIAGIATFHEVVAARILVTNVIVLALLMLLLAAIGGVRLVTDMAIPGWATYTTGFVLVLVIQLVAMSFSLVFTLISNRINMPFIPNRDYQVFIDGLECLAEPK